MVNFSQEEKKSEEAKKDDPPKDEKTSVGEEKKEEKKVEEESKEAKPEPPPPPPPPPEIVLRVFMHCEGCARKVRKSLKGFQGTNNIFLLFLSTFLSVIEEYLFIDNNSNTCCLLTVK